MAILFNMKSTSGYNMVGRNSVPPHLRALRYMPPGELQMQNLRRATTSGTRRVGEHLRILQPTCANGCLPPPRLPSPLGLWPCHSSQLFHQVAADKLTYRSLVHQPYPIYLQEEGIKTFCQRSLVWAVLKCREWWQRHFRWVARTSNIPHLGAQKWLGRKTFL